MHGPARAVWILHLLVCIFLWTGAQAQPLPRAISEAEVRGFIHRLRLTDDEASVAWTLHWDYVAERRSQFQTEIHRFHSRETETIALVNSAENPGVTAERMYPDLDRERQELRSRIIAHEQSLFDSLGALLPPERRDLIQRVRLGRRRFLAAPRDYDDVLPEARPDPIAILLSRDAVGERREAIDALIAASEERYVAALERDLEARLRRDRDRWIEQAIQAQLRTLEPESFARVQLLKEFYERKARAGKRRINAAENLEREALRVVDQAVRCLHPDDAYFVVSRFRDIAHPTIYPDPASADALFENLAQSDFLSESMKNDLAELQRAFSNEHESLSKMMAENRALRHRRGMIADKGYKHELEALDMEFMELAERRYALCARQIRHVLAAVPPDLRDRLPEWDFEQNPRRRPWDARSEFEHDRAEDERRHHEKSREQPRGSGRG